MPGPGARDDHAELLGVLERLHRHKDAAYGDAWRKRGEVIAIFANMARKYDRLLVAFDERRPAAAEPLADTVADLCVYAAKYLTWLAETHPEAPGAADLTLAPERVAADRGPDAVASVLAALATTPSLTPKSLDVDESWAIVRSTFARLERGLMAQATPGSASDSQLDWPTKATLAWQLAGQAAWLLTALAEADDDVLPGLRAEVERMDQVSSA